MLLRATIRVQGLYYVATGAWPCIHMASFEAVTGPKTDDWLVRMVGLLAVAVGAALIAAARLGQLTRSILILSTATAAAFAAIDIIYAGAGRIWPIYFADAAVEIGFMLLLLAARRRAA
jgi:energy-converting hydrogenase Eha subunit E